LSWKAMAAMQMAKKGVGAAVVAGGNPAPVMELGGHAFELVASAISGVHAVDVRFPGRR
jgi:hypothetical protein